MTNESMNIYIEQLIPEKSTPEVWASVLESKEFTSLFTELPKDFQEGNSGSLIWKKLFFFTVNGEYEIESFKENQNILIKISADSFSSVLLITTEENKEGILLRIDHRSFYGKYSKHFKGVFLNRWQRLQKTLTPKKKK